MENFSRGDWDFFLYSGSIYQGDIDKFFGAIAQGGFNTNLSLVLTTYGGDPHAAYKLCRFIRKVYDRIRLVVAGPCKSAGTLVALGSDEVAFGPFGELGPLDVQLTKKDEIVGLSSGLDTLQTFGLVTGYAYSTFESFMLQTVTKSRGGISTKTACEIASQLTTGIFAPLMEQIDPHVLSEVQRKMAIAKAYGQRLRTANVKDEAVDILIGDYPSHGFIIDSDEAGDLFGVVDELHPKELEAVLSAENQFRCAMSPSDDLVVKDLWSLLKEDTDAEDQEGERRGSRSDEPNEGGESSHTESSHAEVSEGKRGSGSGPRPVPAKKAATGGTAKGRKSGRGRGKS